MRCVRSNAALRSPPQLELGAFRPFVQPLLERHPGTQNFSWNPRVTGAERDAFERRMAPADLARLPILDRDDRLPGRTRPASQRDEYLPITFVEPLAANRAVLGLDPLSIASAAGAIERSRRDGQPAVSESFTLTQERDAQRGAVAYQAVLREVGDGLRMIGVVSMAFRMDDAVAASLAGFTGQRIGGCLYDTGASPGNLRLSGPEACEQAAWLRGRLVSRHDIHFAGRVWSVGVRAEQGYASALRTLTPWLSIVTGILGAGLLAAFLLITSGHARRVERLVEQRTRELADAGEDLRAQRSALSRAQEIARMGSWELDPRNGTLHCSDGMRRLLPLPAGNPLRYEDLLGAVTLTDRPRLDRAVSAMHNGGRAVTLDCRPADDPTVTLQFVIDVERPGATDERVVGTAQDVSEARKAAADIQQLAHYDSLTGLPNRMLWALREACAHQRAWHGTPWEDLLVAVNISAIQFNHADFAERVERILREIGADPERIELEITETAIMGSGDDVVARLNELRALGLTLSLDDFGTGYSSLGRLHRLPITRLKLDRSFVQHLPSDQDNAAIANATLSMARALKLEVIAEGIETVAQKAYLFARGCRLMQGYLYSRPLPVDELQRFLDADRLRPNSSVDP